MAETWREQKAATRRAAQRPRGVGRDEGLDDDEPRRSSRELLLRERLLLERLELLREARGWARYGVALRAFGADCPGAARGAGW